MQRTRQGFHSARTHSGWDLPGAGRHVVEQRSALRDTGIEQVVLSPQVLEHLFCRQGHLGVGSRMHSQAVDCQRQARL